MNKQEHIRRKRAIYTGLHPFLKKDELMEALLIWEAKYNDTPGFSVRYYIADLIRQVKPKAEAKQLLVNLVSTLAKPEGDLLPDPSALLDTYKRFNKLHLSDSFSIPVLDAFQLFIVKWLKQPDLKTAEAVVKSVKIHMDTLDIPVDLNLAMLDWLNKRVEKIRLPHVADADLRTLVNAFYVAFCEHCGPVKTDQLLAQAIDALRSNGGAAYSELFKNIL